MSNQTDAAVKRVIAAWTDAGPAPDFHHEAQLWLRRDWPVLADAVIALVRAEAAKRGTNE